MLSKARSLVGFPLALTRNMCFRYGDRAFSNGEHRAADPAEQHGLGQLGMGKQHAKSVGYVLFPLALATPFCLCLEITRAASRYLPPTRSSGRRRISCLFHKVKLSQRVADLVFLHYCFFFKQFKKFIFIIATYERLHTILLYAHTPLPRLITLTALAPNTDSHYPLQV